MAFLAIEWAPVFFIGLIIFYIGVRKSRVRTKAVGGLIAIISLILILIAVFF
jgi:hypothetical protein